jgi:hypothetical protein
MNKFYVIENPAMGAVRVVTHTPRRDEIIVRECSDHREAFAELRAHEREVWRRKARRDGLLAAILIALLLGTAAIIPDLPPPEKAQEVVA